MSPGPDLVLALELADAADAIALGRFRAHDLVVETKPDRTPVTEADRAIEGTIRDDSGRAARDRAILGEELGESGGGGRRWIVDPIDGTRNYSRGIPLFATLIALEDRVAVVSAPRSGGAGGPSAGTAPSARAGSSRSHRLRESRMPS